MIGRSQQTVDICHTQGWHIVSHITASNVLPLLPLQVKVITDSAEHYIGLADIFKREELPFGTQWREVESYREKQVASKEYQWLNFREQK
jgi:hypothetical protein